MANFKLNQGSGGNQPQQNTTTFRIGGNNVPEPEPVIEEPVIERVPDPVPQFDIPTPAPDLIDKIQNTPSPQPDYKPRYQEDEEDEDDIEESNGKRGKNKRKSVKKSNNKKQKDNKPLNADEAYSKFRRKKIVVFIVLIVVAIALVFFGTYNTFFKHTLTQQEAAVYTNKYNSQTQVQSWDSGVQGYLQSNLYTLLKNKFQVSDSQGKEFTVDNITVERNQQLTNEIIMSFFSADITMNGEVNRSFMCLPLSVKDNKYNLAGELEFSNWESYTKDSTTVVENDRLDFNKKSSDDSAAKELKQTCQNFFELGYNLEQDVSDIYKGERKLDFNGKFIEIRGCNVYDEPNQMGYNATVEYVIQLDNGAAYTNKSYLQVEKNSSGSYIIKAIL